MTEKDKYWIRETLKLAKKAKGLTSPNPMVGSIILDENGNKLCDGYHSKAGTDHAEIVALKKAGNKAKNGILYVNLEPCCHYGKTPPCTKAIIEAGIKKVVIGSIDPNEKVSGQGINTLKEAGVEVIYGVLKEKCDELNKFFFHWIQTKKPWITLKIAATLDGYVNLGKHGKKITGLEVQKLVHQMRSEYDAVLTGSGTIIEDNPQLNVRKVKGRNPIRIILDRNFKCPTESKVFNENGKSVIFTQSSTLENATALTNTEIIQFNGNLENALFEIGKKGILSVLVEAGQKLNTTFFEKDLFNDVFYFINPRLYGIPDEKKLNLYSGNLKELEYKAINKVGKDLLITLTKTSS